MHDGLEDAKISATLHVSTVVVSSMITEAY